MILTIWLNRVVKIIILLLVLFPSLPLYAQSLSLDKAYNLAKQNYPLIKQKELIRQTRDITIENLSKGYLPHLSINGQASYQSEVTKVDIPLPGYKIHPLNKDQYKLTSDVNQLVYDGGLSGNKK